MMDFIYQKIDKILRTYGKMEQVALADVYLNFPTLACENSFKSILVEEARVLAAEYGSNEEYEDMLAISVWFYN